MHQREKCLRFGIFSASDFISHEEGRFKGERKVGKKTQKKGRLSVEELEKRVMPCAPKKPGPTPYPPGTKYGLVRRCNLSC